MTEIPKEALERATELVNAERISPIYTAADIEALETGRALARFITDVSEKAKAGQEKLSALYKSRGGVDAEIQGLGGILKSLILPSPEADLLKEAREICAQIAMGDDLHATAADYRSGEHDNRLPMRCTLAALRKGRE